MAEPVEQWICIKFCVKLEHSATETISMIQKITAMGNGWLAASSGQHACSCFIPHAEFFGEHQITQVTQPHYTIDLTRWDFWLKWPLKGKRFHTTIEIQENMKGQLMVMWSTVCAYFVGHWGIIVLWTLFLVSCIFFSKCLYFSYYMAGYVLDRTCMLYVWILVHCIRIFPGKISRNKIAGSKVHWFLSWLVWLSGVSTDLWTKGSPVQFPVRAHAWVIGQVPILRYWDTTTHWCSPLLFLPHFPSLKTNKVFKKNFF